MSEKAEVLSLIFGIRQVVGQSCHPPSCFVRHVCAAKRTLKVVYKTWRFNVLVLKQGILFGSVLRRLHFHLFGIASYKEGAEGVMVFKIALSE